jgi:hypothetical protein
MLDRAEQRAFAYKLIISAYLKWLSHIFGNAIGKTGCFWSSSFDLWLKISIILEPSLLVKMRSSKRFLPF